MPSFSPFRVRRGARAAFTLAVAGLDRRRFGNRGDRGTAAARPARDVRARHAACWPRSPTAGLPRHGISRRATRAHPRTRRSRPGTLLPTYTPGGATTSIGSVVEPNLAVYAGASSGTDGNVPYPSGTVGTPGPLAGYCGTGANVQEAAATPARMPSGTKLPLSPAYFPHVERNPDGSLTGYFDYRPKDADEAIVVPRSTDNGVSWTYQGEALEAEPRLLPQRRHQRRRRRPPQRADRRRFNTMLYTLQRPAGDNDGVGLLVHQLHPLIATCSATRCSAFRPPRRSGSILTPSPPPRVTLPPTGGTGVDIPLTSPVGTGPEQLVAGPFVDLTRTPHPAAARHHHLHGRRSRIASPAAPPPAGPRPSIRRT